jgi:hypothetical protein
MPRISATISKAIDQRIKKHKKDFKITKSKTIERLIYIGSIALDNKLIEYPVPRIALSDEELEQLGDVFGK